MKNTEKGFSLIELLLVVVIFGIVFATIARVMSNVVKSDARLTEQSEALNRTAIITDLLHTDFSNPLRLLSGSEQVPSSNFAANFEPHSDYDLSAGYARRNSELDGAPLLSSTLLKNGNGVASVSSVNSASFGWHTVGAPFSTGFVNFEVGEFQGSSRPFSIVSENGIETTGTLTSEPDKFEARIEHLSVGCRVAFYAVYSNESRLLARSQGVCPAMPLEFIASVSEGGILSNMEFTGAFTPRNTAETLAPFPYIGTIQMDSPVFINPENNDVVLFRATNAKDKMFSTTEANYSPTLETIVTVDLAGKGSFAANDFVFIVDYQGNNSLVGRVLSTALTADDRYMNLNIKPVYTSSSAAWGLFYSRPEDFAGKTFPVGSEVVKLSPPISYRLLAGSKLLMRREGSGLWEAVAPGVSGFTPLIDGDFLQIALSVTTEGIETNLTTENSRINIPMR